MLCNKPKADLNFIDKCSSNNFTINHRKSSPFCTKLWNEGNSKTLKKTIDYLIKEMHHVIDRINLFLVNPS